MTTPTSKTPVTLQGDILLVDDEQPLIELYAEALDQLFACDLATSAKEAETLLHKKKYSVIVSDFSMPGGDGLSLLARVRRDYPETGRILITHYLSPELMPRLNEAAPFRYLLKPVSVPELRKAVQDAARQGGQDETRD